MNPRNATAVMLVAMLLMLVIRAPHGARSASVRVARSAKDRREAVLIGFAWIGYLAPLAWMAVPALSVADYPLRPTPLLAGTACLALGLWVFHRSHADLGTNWSVTLEIRESHRLVTHGIYRAVRHPMYTALLLYGVGQALVVPNWLAGPANLIALVALVMLRLPAEERLMLDTFGGDYAAYMSRTKRLLPGVW